MSGFLADADNNFQADLEKLFFRNSLGPMKKLYFVLSLFVVISACTKSLKKPNTEDEKTLYTMGAEFGNGLSMVQFSSQDKEDVLRGLRDQIAGKVTMKLEEMDEKVRTFQMQKMQSVHGGGEPRARQDGDADILYALGARFVQDLDKFGFSKEEQAYVESGFYDQVKGHELQVKVDDYRVKARTLQGQKINESQQKLAAEESKKAEGFLQEQAAKAGVTKFESGLLMEAIKEGKGKSPKETDHVKVHYHGTLIDGTVFDSSVDRGEPAEFPLNGVIRCWTEGVQKMKVGGKSRLVCPQQIAYGTRSAGKIPPGATLIFEVELLDILKK